MDGQDLLVLHRLLLNGRHEVHINALFAYMVQHARCIRSNCFVSDNGIIAKAKMLDQKIRL